MATHHPEAAQQTASNNYNTEYKIHGFTSKGKPKCLTLREAFNYLLQPLVRQRQVGLGKVFFA
jgi:non-ribosomal peptide synthetase component F